MNDKPSDDSVCDEFKHLIMNERMDREFNTGDLYWFIQCGVSNSHNCEVFNMMREKLSQLLHLILLPLEAFTICIP
jgi:hypothetical protein